MITTTTPFEPPLDSGFTVYSKTECSFCTKVKKLLLDKRIFFLDVQCDTYLQEDKEEFLSFIRKISNKDHRIFPMVFKDGKFIGGFLDTEQYFDKILCFDTDF
jgi:glutaredoxin